MKRSLSLSAALVGVVLLLSSQSLSAKSGVTFVQTQARPVTQLEAVMFAIPSQVLTVWAGTNHTVDDDYNKDRNKDRDKDKDGDGDKDDHHHHHEPTPEPSTLLSFGAAILIGGGVLYSRRLQKKKN